MKSKIKLSDYAANAIKAERAAQCAKREYRPQRHVVSTDKGVVVNCPEDPREWLELIKRGKMSDAIISSYGDAPEGYVWLITKTKRNNERRPSLAQQKS